MTAPEDPRVTAEVDLAGHDYNHLVEQARAAAVDLLGVDRPYWLELRDVQPGERTASGGVPVWRGTARISFPHEPMF